MVLNQAQVNKLYNEMLGRDATFGDASEYDADYWVGKTADQVKSGISGSSEFKNRAALVAGAGDAGISESDLDKMVLPGGWKTEQHTGYTGDLTDFNKGNEWMEGILEAGGNPQTNQNAINTILGATSGNNYSTLPGVGGGGAIDGSVIGGDNTGGNNTGGDNTGGDNTGGNNTGGDNTGGDNTGSTNWYDQFADIDAFKDALGLGDSSSSTSTGGMDDFMRFMMFMSMMRPQGGGSYGGSQYGYGGLNPGGVMSAYNPMDNISSAISAFQTIPGIGTNLTNAT